MDAFTFFVLFVLVILVADPIIKLLEKQKREKAETEAEADLRKIVPWRYIYDIEDIMRSGTNKIRPIYCAGDRYWYYADDIILVGHGEVWLRNYRDSGKDELVLTISHSNIEEFGVPKVYRPQGSEKWEDYLVYLSEHIAEIVAQEKVQEKAEQEAKEQERWKYNHSPLP